MSKSRLAVLSVAVLLCCSFAPAAQVPITVYPNPIQFGIVPENSTSYDNYIYLTNTSTSTVNVTGITISGAGASNFALYGPPCITAIAAGQNCQMTISFTPSTMGSLSASLAVAFTGTGSPLTIPLQGTGGNPIPNIVSLSPPSVYAGSPATTLTINGTNFLSSSIVYFNGYPVTTTYKSSTQLTIQVPAAVLANTGSPFIYVENPLPGGGTSQQVYLQVVSLDPYLQNAFPMSIVAGSGATTISVNGSNFMTGATVLWNGTALPTTYVSSQQLKAQVSASLAAKPQIVQLAVSNPSPGGLSQASNFNVTYAATVRLLDIPANDLVWDPYAQLIYASVPSSYGPNGNTIAVINPATGAITGYYYAGSEPNQLALSADSSYLYVGLNGNGSVQRMILPSFALDINLNLGTNSNEEVNVASDLQVFPGDPHSFAVALGAGECCGAGSLEFFTNAKLLNSIAQGIGYLHFANATTLYGYDYNTLSEIAVSATGGKISQQWTGLLDSNAGIQYDAGLIYSDGGQVFNPSTGELAGVYDVEGSYNNNNYLLPESAINAVFELGTSPFFSSFGITSYNLSQFTPVAVINLAQLIGSTPTPTLISWGSNGLAFAVQTDCCGNQSTQTVLVQSAMLAATVTDRNPVPVASSLSTSNAAHGSGNFKLTVNGSDFVASSKVTWNGAEKTVSYVSPTQLTVFIPWSDVKSPGSATVVVKNPAPGGGKSKPLTFTIN